MNSDEKDVDSALELDVTDAGTTLEPVEITIDGDKTEVKPVEAAKKPETKPEIISAEAGIDDLKRQIAEERQRRADAERQRAESEQKAAEASKRATEGDYNSVLSALDTAKLESENAERELQAAFEAGDYKKVAESQRKIARSETRIMQLEAGKGELEAKRAAPVTEGRVQAPPSDPVEAIARQLSPASASWLRAHPEAANVWGKVTAAHAAATELEGLKAETPEYFDYVETRLGYKVAKEAPRERSAPIVAAPASRDAPSLSSGQSTRQTITLTPEERAAAREMDMTDREYAIEKLAAIKAGQITAH